MINRNEQNQVISLKSALCMTENAWLEKKNSLKRIQRELRKEKKTLHESEKKPPSRQFEDTKGACITKFECHTTNQTNDEHSRRLQC